MITEDVSTKRRMKNYARFANIGDGQLSMMHPYNLLLIHWYLQDSHILLWTINTGNIET